MMRKRSVLLICLALIFGMAGCADKNSDSSGDLANASGTAGSLENASGDGTGTADAGASVDLTGSITTIKLGDAISISGTGAAADGNTVSITAPGNYSISGTLSNGQIVVDCDKAIVNLELAGVDITNSSGPAIYVADAKMTNIILKEGTANHLTDSGSYANADLKAALFSEDSLIIKGSGTLYVKGKYKHGIASDDVLLIEGGNINVQSAVTDGLHANDNITIDGGNISVNASSDGIESELTVTVNGGTLNIAAGDDGIHAETDLVINGGTIHVTKSYEGLEGKTVITISNGNIKLKSDDDAINAGTNLVINGGYIYADAGGDGMDSNGNMTINGGTIIVFSGNNANGPIDIGDRNATFTINGGTVIATGGNMGITVSSSSKQYSMWISSPLAADTLVNISGPNGSEVATFTLIKSSSLIFYSSDKLAANTTYNINTGGSHSGQTADSVYSGGAYSGGTALGSVTTTSKNVSFGNAGGGMGGWNDFGTGEGGRRPRS